MNDRLRAVLPATAVAVFAAGALAIAQPGGEEGTLEVDAERGSAFGECVSAASEAGAENPAAECEELRPGAPEGRGGNGNGNGDEDGGDNGSRFDELCGDESKEDGSFGECVAANASAFGQCVAANSEAGVANPAAACAELRPGNGPDGTPSGPPEGTPNGPPEGTPSGPPEGTPNGPPEGTPSGPPEGTPSGPPEGTPSGPPEGTPSGPPEGVGGGRPGS